MGHPDLIILGYSEAAMLMRQTEGRSVRAMLGIRGQREHFVETDGLEHVLQLEFDDTETPRDDDMLQAARIRLRQREAADFGLRLSPPTIDHVRSIIAFANQVAAIDGTVLCHCHAGISRSPAAGLICLTTWLGPGSEANSMAMIRRTRPAASPHRDLVRFADELLDRGGKLLGALET